VNVDTIPAFTSLVVNLLNHAKPAVRKKAVMAIHRFWLKSPEVINGLGMLLFLNE
jgi:AP-4 complex subunit epsilon-1